MKAPSTALTLQVCADCGQIQYPRREVCRRCLSTQLVEQRVSSSGVVLAQAVLHIGLEEQSGLSLPLQLVTVAVDGGVNLIAVSHDVLSAGDRVKVTRHEGRLWAIPDSNNNRENSHD